VQQLRFQKIAESRLLEKNGKEKNMSRQKKRMPLNRDFRVPRLKDGETDGQRAKDESHRPDQNTLRTTEIGERMTRSLKT